MVALQFFFADEVNCCVVISKVVGHLLDLFLNSCSVCAFLKDYEALSCVLVSCGELRVLAASNCLKCALYRDCVLLGILDTLNSSDGI